MECTVYICKGMAGIPMAELGGLVCQNGISLIVPKQLGKELEIHYGSKLIKAGEVKKDFLKNGRYELSNQAVIDSTSVIKEVSEYEKSEHGNELGLNKDMVTKKMKVKNK